MIKGLIISILTGIVFVELLPFPALMILHDQLSIGISPYGVRLWIGVLGIAGARAGLLAWSVIRYLAKGKTGPMA